MLIRRAGLIVVAAAMLIVGARAWASRPHVAPTALTAASLSLDVGAPRNAEAAAQLVARLEASGIAAYTRSVETTVAGERPQVVRADLHIRPRRRGRHQVMAGPYVSLDEADAMQRRLRALGFGAAPLFVDDSLRRAPRNAAPIADLGNPGLVLVGAPGRLSLAFEMRSQPRQVNARRVGATLLQVDIGPLESAIEPQSWNAPAGVHLIRGVAVEEIGGSAGVKYARATLSVPEFARANTRIEGRRVYIDLTWPEESPRAAADEPPLLAARMAEDRRHTVAAAEPAPVVDLSPFVERLARVLPFVQAAAKSPSADVLQALWPTMDEIASSLAQITPTPEMTADYNTLTAAVAAAQRAVDPASAGNRVIEAERASALVLALERP